MKTNKIAIFASGSGSNFQAIAQAINEKKINAQLCLLVCDNPNAKVLERAKNLKIDTHLISPKAFDNKNQYEENILAQLKQKGIEWIILAGYMQLIGNVLLTAYPNKIINIHPSLLPAFKGKDAIRQAIEYGVKIVGVSIHYVDAGIDTGKIIAQKAIEIQNQESENDLTQRLHTLEHELYINTLSQLFLTP